MRNVLPIIEQITPIQISKLMRIGFAYVRLPDPGVENSLWSLHASGLNFFRSSHEYKQRWSVNEKFEGYADRENDKNPQSIKQFFFRPQSPIGPFKKDEKVIQDIYRVFHDNIALNLLQNIFLQAGLGKYYHEACGKTFPSLSFAYYPEKSRADCHAGLNPHKDFDMITVLWITQPGLEIFYEGAWHQVNPKPGYVVVNLANALEIMLGKKSVSALHQVRLTQEERLSIGMFVGSVGPVKEYTSGRVVYETYSDYLASQFNRQYEEPKLVETDHKKSSNKYLTVRGIFSKKKQESGEAIPSSADQQPQQNDERIGSSRDFIP